MILVVYNNRKKNDVTPYFYYALEEYILNFLPQKDQTFFFQWEIKGIVIGKNQIIENELNMDFVKKIILIFSEDQQEAVAYITIQEL
ncbi:MAG: hypothetical protein Q8783_01345 [Candidatus Phytoplasma stylosanthis]|nr:hypothetical protein [Candidatus Phytoplasma stylosanthis]